MTRRAYPWKYGPRDQVDEFGRVLNGVLPPLARVTSIEEAVVPPVEQERDFSILVNPQARTTWLEVHGAVSADAALCPDCLHELFDSANRRHRHALIACTNCGPRFSILREIPYDRPNTTMAGFALCPRCTHEYREIADRRYHAQP